MTNLTKAVHYLDARLEILHIPTEYRTKSVFLKDLDGKVVDYTVQHFEKRGNDIRINYHDLDGKPFVWSRKRSSSLHASGQFTQQFYRLRLSPEKVAMGSPKYIQDGGSSVLPYLNGLVQFYKSDLHCIKTVYISEGEFKAFVGCQHDIPTIGVGGIHMFSKNKKDQFGRTIKNEFLPEIIEALDRMPNLERIVLLHDSDALDGDDDRRRAFFTSLKYFNWCVKDYNDRRKVDNRGFLEAEYWHGKDPEFKGLDDLLIGRADATDDFTSGFSEYHYKHILFKHGDTGKMVHERLDHLKRWFRLNDKPFRAPFVGFNLHIQKRVSERKVEVMRLVNEHPRLLIQAPTGSGKTYTFLKEIIPARLAANLDERVAFVVPTKALAEEISAAYDLPLVHGGITGDERIMAVESRLYVTTYDSAPLLGIADTIIVDEAHTLTRDFRARAKQGLEDLMDAAERTVMLTATPTALWEHFGYKLVNIKQEDPKVREIDVNEIGPTITLRNVCADLVYAASKEDEGKVSFIRMNHKTALKTVMTEAIKSGLFHEDQVAYIDSADENKGPVYDSITSNSMVPPGTRLVLMTSLMDEGVNINNTNIARVHFLQDKISGDLRDEQAIQFVSRFRKWDGKAELYVKKDDRELGNSWDPKRYLEQQINAANAELQQMHYRGNDPRDGENFIRTHSERGLLQYSEMRGSWMVSQNGVITDTLSFFAKRLPVSEYVRQLKAFPGFKVNYNKHREGGNAEDNFQHLKEAKGFRINCKESGRVKSQDRRRLREEFDKILAHDPEGVIAAFYRHYARPFDKSTIKDIWPRVESWEPAYSKELGKINAVHTVYSYIYDLGKLYRCGIELETAVELYLNWYGTKSFKLLYAAFEFWGVMKRYKMGKKMSQRDRQLAERIDSVRVFLIEMHHKKEAFSLHEIKQLLHQRGVRVRKDDLRLWVDVLADVRETASKGKRRLVVDQIVGMDQYYTRFSGVQKVGYFLSDTPKKLHPKNGFQRRENQRFTSKKENPIFKGVPLQIGTEKRAKTNGKTSRKRPPNPSGSYGSKK